MVDFNCEEETAFRRISLCDVGSQILTVLSAPIKFAITCHLRRSSRFGEQDQWVMMRALNILIFSEFLKRMYNGRRKKQRQKNHNTNQKQAGHFSRNEYITADFKGDVVSIRPCC